MHSNKSSGSLKWKKITFTYNDSKRGFQQAHVAVQEGLNARTSTGDTRNTHRRHGDTPRTQTTSRQPSDVVQKPDRKTGSLWWVGAGFWIGVPEDICPLLPTLLPSLFRHHHSIQSPSSNSDSSSESEYSTAMRRERMVATSLPTRSCLASCSRCSSTFRSWMPEEDRRRHGNPGDQDSLGHKSWCFPTFPDGFQQDAARVADGRQIGWVVPLGPQVV